VRLLALDQASRTSGYAVFVDDELITYGTFTYEDEDIGVRLYKIREKVKGLIDLHSIDYVVLEDIQLQGNVVNNVQTFKTLAEVFGVIYELVTELKIEHEAVLSSSWKSTLNIKGRTRPDQKKNA
jgi:Holliday junction resolvasome RuvABC endonuclease subunit